MRRRTPARARCRTALALLAAAVGSSLAASAASWRRLPSMEAYGLVAITDAGEGRVHGIDQGGNVYLSIDSGNGWTRVGSLPLPRETPTHVVFTSPDTGYAGSALSSVWRTVDGGGSWKKVFSDFLLPWKRFEFFHGKAGLALNETFLVRTRDAWTTPEIVRRDVEDVQILDSRRAVILAFDTLYASSDTGMTWNPLPWTAPAGGSILGFHFADARHGYAQVKTGRAAARDTLLSLYRTEDAGATWSLAGQATRQPNRLPPPPFAHILFRDSLQGISWEVAEDEEGIPRFLIHRTGDGGRTWTEAAPTEALWTGQGFLRGRGGDLWTFGFGGALGRSRDAGRTWEKLGGGPARTYAPAHFQDRMRGVAVSGISDGTLWQSRDGGRTWRSHPGIGGTTLSDLHFTDAKRGFAVGDSGRVMKTGDGGESWIPFPFPLRTRLTRVRFHDSAIGMVGNPDSVFVTYDGGRAWRLIRGSEASSQGITGFALADARYLYVTVGRESFRVSTDGGVTWRDAAPELPRGAAGSMVFPAPGVHYAVGAEGAFLASRDAGATWEMRSYVPGPPWPPTPRSLSLSFSSPDTGFVSGDSGLVFSTYDGGRTWNQARLPGSGRVVWLAHASGTPVWAMTNDGDTWEYPRTPTAMAPFRPHPSFLPSQSIALREGRLVIGSDASWSLRLEARDARGRALWSMPRLQGSRPSEIPLPGRQEPFFLVIQGPGRRSILRVPVFPEAR